MAVKNISKEEYANRLDIPKNLPGNRSNSVKKRSTNQTIDLAQFELSGQKQNNRSTMG
jgi:hypothetical protein